MTAPASANQRKHPRHDVSIDVVVVLPNAEPVTMKTGNLSHGGVFLLANGQNPLPEVGTEFVLTLSEFLESTEPMAMRARVAHRSEAGIGVEFLGPV